MWPVLLSVIKRKDSIKGCPSHFGIDPLTLFLLLLHAESTVTTAKDYVSVCVFFLVCASVRL